MEGALLGQLQVEFLQAGVCGGLGGLIVYVLPLLLPEELLAQGQGQARGVVQIVHGVAEHIGRYDAPARFLASRGYLVCGDWAA